jgi:hypothetical protein
VTDSSVPSVLPDHDTEAFLRVTAPLWEPLRCGNCGAAATHRGHHPEAGTILVCDRCMMGQGFRHVTRLPAFDIPRKE